MADQAHDEDAVIAEFREAVNMTASEIKHWLRTGHSQEVGQKKDGEGESIGHQSGTRIIELLHKHRDEYTENDVAHMRKVISYVHRHLAQKPSGDIDETRWHYSLMNWGHDPLKD